MRHYRIAFRLASLILAMGLVMSSHAKSDEVYDVSKPPQSSPKKTVKEQLADGKIVKMRKETVDRRIAYGGGMREGREEVADRGRARRQTVVAS